MDKKREPMMIDSFGWGGGWLRVIAAALQLPDLEKVDRIDLIFRTSEYLEARVTRDESVEVLRTSFFGVADIAKALALPHATQAVHIKIEADKWVIARSQFAPRDFEPGDLINVLNGTVAVAPIEAEGDWDPYDGEVWLEDEDDLAQWEQEGEAPFLSAADDDPASTDGT